MAHRKNRGLLGIRHLRVDTVRPEYSHRGIGRHEDLENYGGRFLRAGRCRRGFQPREYNL